MPKHLVVNSTISTTYALTLAYKGTNFSGFAKQTDSTIATVQAALESALNIVLRAQRAGYFIETVCAGRTDAGVHALGQTISFDFPGNPFSPHQCGRIVRALNALTPDDISVASMQPMSPGFSARFDAVQREYRYRIYNNSQPSIFNRDFSWQVIPPMNLDLMCAGAQHFLGEHDFTSFCAARSASPEKNMQRTIHAIEISNSAELAEPIITVRVIGTAFLHSMVRIIVGTLVEVATLKREAESIPTVLTARDRRAAGITAPAHGLTFHQVIYPDSSFL